MANVGRLIAQLAAAGPAPQFGTAQVEAWTVGNRRVLLFGESTDVDCWDAALSVAVGDIVLTLAVGNTTAVLCKLAAD